MLVLKIISIYLLITIDFQKSMGELEDTVKELVNAVKGIVVSDDTYLDDKVFNNCMSELYAQLSGKQSDEREAIYRGIGETIISFKGKYFDKFRDRAVSGEQAERYSKERIMLSYMEDKYSEFISFEDLYKAAEKHHSHVVDSFNRALASFAAKPPEEQAAAMERAFNWLDRWLEQRLAQGHTNPTYDKID